MYNFHELTVPKNNPREDKHIHGVYLQTPKIAFLCRSLSCINWSAVFGFLLKLAILKAVPRGMYDGPVSEFLPMSRGGTPSASARTSPTKTPARNLHHSGFTLSGSLRNDDSYSYSRLLSDVIIDGGDLCVLHFWQIVLWRRSCSSNNRPWSYSSNAKVMGLIPRECMNS